VESKSEQIRQALAAGDRLTALRIAARFHDQSGDTKTYKRGFDAHNNPVDLLDRNFRSHFDKVDAAPKLTPIAL
jgi:hypothetical protein